MSSIPFQKKGRCTAVTQYAVLVTTVTPSPLRETNRFETITRKNVRIFSFLSLYKTSSTAIIGGARCQFRVSLERLVVPLPSMRSNVGMLAHECTEGLVRVAYEYISSGLEMFYTWLVQNDSRFARITISRNTGFFTVERISSAKTN